MLWSAQFSLASVLDPELQDETGGGDPLPQSCCVGKGLELEVGFALEVAWRSSRVSPRDASLSAFPSRAADRCPGCHVGSRDVEIESRVF